MDAVVQVGSREAEVMEVILHIHWALVRPHLEYYVQVFLPSTRDMKLLNWVQQSTIREWSTWLSWECYPGKQFRPAQNMGNSFLQLWKRTQSIRRTTSVDRNPVQISRGGISSISITLEGRLQENGHGIFLVMSSNSRDHRRELKLKRFSLNVRKHFFYW